MNRESVHDAGVMKIYLNPFLVGLENIVCKSLNCVFIQNKSIIYIPDIIFYNKQIWVLEYKCSDYHRMRAHKQLLKAEVWIRENWGVNPHLIYAFGERPEYEVLK
jgi:hypothetical protein